MPGYYFVSTGSKPKVFNFFAQNQVQKPRKINIVRIPLHCFLDILLKNHGNVKTKTVICGSYT